MNKKIISTICLVAVLASCNSKRINNHIMNDSLDSASLSAGRATRDSGMLDTLNPIKNDSSGEQTDRMNNTGPNGN